MVYNIVKFLIFCQYKIAGRKECESLVTKLVIYSVTTN